MMNDKLTHLTRALSFGLLFGHAGAGMLSAEETLPGTANEAVGVSLYLPWLQILVEGDRDAAEALRGSLFELVFTDSTSGASVLIDGEIDLPSALIEGDGNASVLVDRYPMAPLVYYGSDYASRLDREIASIKLLKLNGEGEIVTSQKDAPRSWRTFDVSSHTATKPVWVVLIERAQYCPLVDLADVPDCDGIVESPEESGEEPTNVASAEAATKEPVRPRARDQTAALDVDGQDVAEAEAVSPPLPEPVDYAVKISLAFAGTTESTYGRPARSLNESCAIAFEPSGDVGAVVADVDFRATPPVIKATLLALPDAPIDLTEASLRFEQSDDALIDCAYDGVVVALDGMSQNQTMVAGEVVLPAEKPRFDLIYDLSGKVIGDDPSRSGAVVVGFATLVADVLDARLTNVSSRYGSLDDYFAWTPGNSVDPKLEPMSALDTDSSASPSRTQYLHALNEGIQTQMLSRIEESVVGVRPSQIAELLVQAGERFSTLLDAGDLRARDTNLRLLVQVANTARGACLDASMVETAPNADIRQTTVKRIVAVAEPRLSFDAELTEETSDSLILRCTPTEGSLVETWLVPLSDVARTKDWLALTNQIGNLNRRLVP